MLDLSSTASLIQLMAAINLTSSFIKDFKKYFRKELEPLYLANSRKKFEQMETKHYLNQTSELFDTELKPKILDFENKYSAVTPSIKRDIKALSKKLNPSFILTGIYCVMILFVYGTQQQLLFTPATPYNIESDKPGYHFEPLYTTSAEFSLLLIGVVLIFLIIRSLRSPAKYTNSRILFFIILSFAIIILVKMCAFTPIKYADWHKFFDLIILALTTLPLLLLYMLTYFGGKKLSIQAEKDFAEIRKIDINISSKNKADLDALFK